MLCLIVKFNDYCQEKRKSNALYILSVESQRNLHAHKEKEHTQTKISNIRLICT